MKQCSILDQDPSNESLSVCDQDEGHLIVDALRGDVEDTKRK
jgi:hypothetical protein